MTPTSTPKDKVPDTIVTQSLGTYLVELRLTQNLSLQEASLRTKYARLQLEALEHEQWDKLPSGAPLRWMVKSYGRFLGADEDVLLSLLGTQRVITPVADAASMNQELTGHELSLESQPKQRVFGWLVAIAILILVALFYALNQGLIPEDWLVFEWLKEFRS